MLPPYFRFVWVFLVKRCWFLRVVLSLSFHFSKEQSSALHSLFKKLSLDLFFFFFCSSVESFMFLTSWHKEALRFFHLNPMINYSFICNGFWNHLGVRCPVVITQTFWFPFRNLSYFFLCFEGFFYFALVFLKRLLFYVVMVELVSLHR